MKTNQFEVDYTFPKRYFDILLTITLVILFFACVAGIFVARYKLELDFMEKEIESLHSEKKVLEADLVYYRKEYIKLVSK